MTIFAGIVDISGEALCADHSDKLALAVSRHQGEHVDRFVGPNYAFVKVDVGAFQSAGYHRDADGTLALLAGEPFPSMDGASGRKAHLVTLAREWHAGGLVQTQSCSGTFCAAYWHPAERRLWLIADKLGVRPIYFYVTGKKVYFATALRILEKLRGIHLRMDVRALVEISCFGYPLADRTAYVGVKTINAGEIVEFLPGHSRRISYWRWDGLPPRTESAEDVQRELLDRFETAIRKRLGAQTTVVSFLSGGLDSRAVVAVLRQMGVTVHSINAAPEGTLDLVLGREIASRLGTLHYEYSTGRAFFHGGPREVHTRWLDAIPAGTSIPERPHVVWSGDGGSVGLGHVYLNERLIQLVRRGNLREAAEAFLRDNNWGVPKKLFRDGISQAVAEVPWNSIVEELNRLEGDDLGRKLHLFLMLNDQRRHLAAHFERIDLQRIELTLPFFDADFLEPVVSNPVDGFLSHRFYNEWLKQLPAPTREVAWQAYPGHLPSLVPPPQTLRYQWGSTWWESEDDRRARKELIAKAGAMVRDPFFPKPLLSRSRLRAARWAMRAGFRDFGYVIRTAGLFVSHWQRCQGQYDLSGLGAVD